MARSIETVTRVSVSDDVTGIKFTGMSDDLGEWMDVHTYRITITELNEKGEVCHGTETEFVKDMHNSTYRSIIDFIDGSSDKNL